MRDLINLVERFENIKTTPEQVEAADAAGAILGVQPKPANTAYGADKNYGLYCGVDKVGVWRFFANRASVEIYNLSLDQAVALAQWVKENPPQLVAPSEPGKLF